MKRIALVPVAVIALAGVLAHMAPASEPPGGSAAPIFGIKMFAGYRDWKLISVAHEAGNLNDIRAILGNDKAIVAYRMSSPITHLKHIRRYPPGRPSFG